MRPIIYQNQSSDEDDEMGAQAPTTTDTVQQLATSRQARLQIIGLLQPNHSQRVFLA